MSVEISEKKVIIHMISFFATLVFVAVKFGRPHYLECNETSIFLLGIAPSFIGAYVVPLSFSTQEFKHPILSNFNYVLAICLTPLVVYELASINSTSDTYDPYDILFSVLGAGAALITFTFLNARFKE